MAIRFSTAYKGVQHVTADDVGGVQQGMFGENDYVLGVGKRMAGTLVTNNNVKIEDGEAVMQGRHFRIEPNTYENVTIENGTQNMNRKDLIVWRYTKNAQTGVENIELAVLKGTPTSGTPTLKTPTKGDIQAGALLHEMPLYVVHLKGPNIVIVEPAFRVLMNMEEMEERLNDFGWKDLINSNGSWIKYRRKTVL